MNEDDYQCPECGSVYIMDNIGTWECADCGNEWEQGDDW